MTLDNDAVQNFKRAWAVNAPASPQVTWTVLPPYWQANDRPKNGTLIARSGAWRLYLCEANTKLGRRLYYELYHDGIDGERLSSTTLTGVMNGCEALLFKRNMDDIGLAHLIFTIRNDSVLRMLELIIE